MQLYGHTKQMRKMQNNVPLTVEVMGKNVLGTVKVFKTD